MAQSFLFYQERAKSPPFLSYVMLVISSNPHHFLIKQKNGLVYSKLKALRAVIPTIIHSFSALFPTNIGCSSAFLERILRFATFSRGMKM